MAPDFYLREHLEPAFPDKSKPPLISYGLRFPDACAKHVEHTYGASRIYLIVSNFLATKTDAVDRLQQTLGSKVVGKRVGMKPHTFWSEVVSIINDARPLDPDCIITLGAGSLTDAAKIIAWALANNVSTVADLGTLAATAPTQRSDLQPPTINIISVPTSLSGGEYQAYAGATNDSTMEKTLFTPPRKNPALVVLDPEITLTTPDSIWLSTGIRSLDHCIESLCSLQSSPESDVAALEATRMLITALLRCQSDPQDLVARHLAQLGARRAMVAVSYGVPMGASHAIGHQLGPQGVGHGETSCIMLPAVCKYNAAKGANVAKQAAVAEALLEIGEVRSLVDGSQDNRRPDLGDVLDLVIRRLGMPRTFHDVGLTRDKFDILAENTLRDKWAKTNPVPLTEKKQVMEILEMVVE